MQCSRSSVHTNGSLTLFVREDRCPCAPAGSRLSQLSLSLSRARSLSLSLSRLAVTSVSRLQTCLLPGPALWSTGACAALPNAHSSLGFPMTCVLCAVRRMCEAVCLYMHMAHGYMLSCSLASRDGMRYPRAPHNAIAMDSGQLCSWKWINPSVAVRVMPCNGRTCVRAPECTPTMLPCMLHYTGSSCGMNPRGYVPRPC